MSYSGGYSGSSGGGGGGGKFICLLNLAIATSCLVKTDSILLTLIEFFADCLFKNA